MSVAVKDIELLPILLTSGWSCLVDDIFTYRSSDGVILKICKT